MSQVPIYKVVEHLFKQQNDKLLKAAKLHADRKIKMAEKAKTEENKKWYENQAALTLAMAGEMVKKNQKIVADAVKKLKKYER